MSPSPARTTSAEILAAGRAVLEDEGLDALTMASVAGRVGIRPPSLYKHVRDRSELVTLVDLAPTLFALWKLSLDEPDRAREQVVRLHAHEGGAFELPAYARL